MNDTLAVVRAFDVSLLIGSVAPSSQAVYRRDIAAYLTFAGSAALALLPVTLVRFRTHLAETTDMSPNTINRMLSAVKRVVRAAADHNYLDRQLADAFGRVEGVKIGAMKEKLRQHNRVRITAEQMRGLIDSLDRRSLVGLRNVALVTTLASSGLRVNELSQLRQEQILVSGQYYLLHLYATLGKNKIEDHDAPISVEAVDAIRTWLASRPVESPYIFTSFAGRGARATAEPITPQGVWAIVKELAERQGLPDVKPHDFRRFVGTRLAKQDAHMAQLALGHARIETTIKHYVLEELQPGLTDHLC